MTGRVVEVEKNLQALCAEQRMEYLLDPWGQEKKTPENSEHSGTDR